MWTWPGIKPEIDTAPAISEEVRANEGSQGHLGHHYPYYGPNLGVDGNYMNYMLISVLLSTKIDQVKDGSRWVCAGHCPGNSMCNKQPLKIAYDLD